MFRYVGTGPFPAILNTSCLGTDDRDWASVHIVSETIRLSPETDIAFEFTVLHQAVGLVIANSTFSFWAAFLRPDRKIVMPSMWFRAGHYSGDHWLNGTADHFNFPGVKTLHPETGADHSPIPESHKRLSLPTILPVIRNMLERS